MFVNSLPNFGIEHTDLSSDSLVLTELLYSPEGQSIRESLMNMDSQNVFHYAGIPNKYVPSSLRDIVLIPAMKLFI